MKGLITLDIYCPILDILVHDSQLSDNICPNRKNSTSLLTDPASLSENIQIFLDPAPYRSYISSG